jgi:hypothetical protein
MESPSNSAHLKGEFMSNQDNQDLINVTNSGAGGFNVEIRYNGYNFNVLATRESLTFQALDHNQTEELLYVLEGVLDELKTEIIIAEVLKRLPPNPSKRAGDKSLDDP